MTSMELKNRIDQLENAWSNFKQVNDRRLEEIAAKGLADPLTTESISRLNSVIDDCKERISSLEIEKSRPTMGGCETKSNPQDKQFDQYLRTGFMPALEAKGHPYNTSDQDYGSALVGPRATEIILRKANELSVFRKIATVEKINTNTLDLLIDQDDLTIPDRGWSKERAEAGGITSTGAAKVFIQRVDTYEVYAQPTASSKLIEDSRYDFTKYISEKLGDIFGEEEERVCLYGDGVDQPRGIMSHPIKTDNVEEWGSINEIQSGVAGEITSDSLLSLSYALHERYMRDAALLMHRSTLAAIRQLKLNSQYIWQPSFANGGQETIMGIPVHCSQYMPIVAPGARAVMLASFRKAFILADRTGISLLVDKFSYKPLVAFYARKRIAFAVMDSKGVKLLKVSGN